MVAGTSKLSGDLVSSVGTTAVPHIKRRHSHHTQPHRSKTHVHSSIAEVAHQKKNTAFPCITSAHPAQPIDEVFDSISQTGIQRKRPLTSPTEHSHSICHRQRSSEVQ